ncbi:MAG: GNAT family N-acetyltransferase [Deltaproteobacteria bacterium]|nr:GNAT family N-acetyltransferase [Deltaproteobacteria bacterium]
METLEAKGWRDRLVSPEKVLEKLKPGMNIFLGTGMAEPRTLIKYIVEAKSKKIQDLEFLQLGSFGDAASILTKNGRHRLKSFFSGRAAEEAIKEGRMDIIPCRPSKIPSLIESGQLPIDAAFIQVTPPNPAGYCSLGGAIDVAVLAMEQASLRVAEIDSKMPFTFGDTFVHFSEFDMCVESTEPLIHNPRPVVDNVTDQIAANLASVIDDGSCIAFSADVIFEALAKRLVSKKHLGIHSPFITDAVMDLVKSGAVTNRRKANWRGRSVGSYAFGTPELMAWLDRNPLVEFQGLDKVFDPVNIGKNSKVVTVSRAYKIDLTGRIVLPFRREQGVMERAVDIYSGASLSAGGRRLLALPSRDSNGESNIVLSVEGMSNQFGIRETVDMIVTEYGIASLFGRTIRERAQAIIDIAHPDDRPSLVEEAKNAKIIYQDQIFLKESAHLYPQEIQSKHTFKDKLELRFRAIRPSDEEEMRRLFYRFSEEGVYYRYFTPIMAMPHKKMQEYVNVDYNRTMSIVALEGDVGKGKIIAEARYIKLHTRPYAEVAFIVDEKHQGYGIASYLMQMLIIQAKKNRLKGFIASVNESNGAMLRVFKKSGMTVETRLEDGVFSVTMHFQ